MECTYQHTHTHTNIDMDMDINKDINTQQQGYLLIAH